MLRAATVDVTVRTFRNETLPFMVTSGSQSVTGIGNWSALGTVLCREDEDKPLTDDEIQALLSKQGGRRYTPVSDHFFTVLAPLYRSQFASDDDYAEAFDRTEVLLDAISEDERAVAEASDQHYFGGHGGYGRYTWRHRYGGEKAPELMMLEEARAQGAGWTPLLGGLFGGESERSISALERVHHLATSIRSSR